MKGEKHKVLQVGGNHVSNSINSSSLSRKAKGGGETGPHLAEAGETLVYVGHSAKLALALVPGFA